ncbi:MAG: alpha/beta-hydrolase family protein [Actinobacteria bacterium]|nr:alpha/beta-hydrolase family protein [Actinomycetota bacterium]
MPSAKRIFLAPPSLAGLTLGAVGFAAALTPSLLPHKLMFLLLLTAIGTLSGYAIGTTVSWLLNKIPWVRSITFPRLVRFGIPIVVWLGALSFTPIAVTWQAEQQSELDMPEALPSTLVVIFGTAAIAAVLLLISRAIRVGSNALARLVTRIPPVGRWTGGDTAGATNRRGMIVRAGVAVALIALASTGLNVGIALLVSSYDSVNADASGQSPTNLGENSGSPQSLTPWDTLGREGRFYVSNTMTPAEIEQISGAPAATPVRVYVGMQQGDTPEARTALALKELDRVKAWDRPYLVIYAVTGTGWVNPDGINSLEAVTGGDVTTVAVQYSAVPSWIGFVLDQATTQIQNRDTVTAIVDAWKARPADQRPELVLFGESLGSFGSQAAWEETDGPEQVSADVQKIVWIGPPAESTLWKTWQADRSSGPAWQPVMGDGSIARVYISADDLADAQPNSGPAITFVAHPNDPVVYWSPDLLLRQPDWLDAPLGPGVAPQMRWFPIITFLQVGMDLISGGEPPEVGHNYASGIGPAVALTVNPPGWTPAATTRLQAALPDLMYVTG